MTLSVTTWSPQVVRGRALLVHGITGSSASWWRVADHLVARGLVVVAPDLRGHGNSPRPTGGYTFDDLVADLAEVAGTEVDLLVGHSFGATLAVAGLAAGCLDAGCTVLEDPVLALGVEQARTVAEDEIAWTPPDVRSLLVENPAWLPQDVAGRVLAHYQMDAAAVRASWTANAPWDLLPSLTHARARTRLVAVVPEHSPYNDRARVDLLVQRLGRENVAEVAGAGHSVHREAFATFVALLDDLLAA